MNTFRLAIVRQKYRPDGGAERFVSRALEALDNQSVELNVITRSWIGAVQPQWHIHIVNPLNGEGLAVKRVCTSSKTLLATRKV